MIKDTKAAAALVDLEAIRDNPAPYGQISRIEPLIATVDGVNDGIAQDKREKALLSIDNKIAEVQKKLDAVQAEANLRNKALTKLQELKTKVAGLSSIPMIFFCQEQAGDALDEAMTIIESALHKPTPTAQEPGTTSKPLNTGTGSTVTVAPKPAKVIRAADLATQSYLETEAEVEDYIAKLKAELMAAIKAGQRARIQ